MRAQPSTRMEPASRHPSLECSDEQCAQCACERGCRACFEELVRRFQSPLLHFLIRQIGSRHDAEDLLQETFLQAHRKLASYNSDWRFGTWLFTIAYRLAISKKRRRRWFVVSADAKGDDMDWNGKSSALDPLKLAQDKDGCRKLWDDVANILDASTFTAIWLSYVEAMSAPEIGVILGKSPNGVRILLHRARGRLMERLGPEWKPEGTV